MKPLGETRPLPLTVLISISTTYLLWSRIDKSGKTEKLSQHTEVAESHPAHSLVRVNISHSDYLNFWIIRAFPT